MCGSQSLSYCTLLKAYKVEAPESHSMSNEKIKQRETGIMFSAIYMKVPKNEV